MNKLLNWYFSRSALPYWGMRILVKSLYEVAITDIGAKRALIYGMMEVKWSHQMKPSMI